MALTFTSPDDQTTSGSSFGSKVITLANSVGPPARRELSSERRWAISPDWRNASAMCVTYFRQLLVNPRTDTASEAADDVDLWAFRMISMHVCKEDRIELAW